MCAGPLLATSPAPGSASTAVECQGSRKLSQRFEYSAELIAGVVEIAPMHDVGNITMIHAERMICNFIGATIRAGYYDRA